VTERNGTLVTTSQTPWTSGAARERAGRQPLFAAVAAVLAVLLTAAATTWQLWAFGGSAEPAAGPPEPGVPPAAVPSEDRGEPLPDLPAPTDHWSDDAVVPPAPAPVEPIEELASIAEPTAPVEEPRTDPATGPAAQPADDPAEEPGGVEPAPAVDPEPSPAPKPDRADLAAVQARLKELGYLLGPADGVKGQQTVAAVMAFQRVNGLSVDGVVGPMTLAALESPRAPELRGGPATRVEVDLTRQLAHVVRDGTRVVTLQVSSGNGAAYASASGGTTYARTPVGEFRIERRIHGVRESRLGILYDPLYFYNGYAIHGSNSVPPYPASHGCVRVSRADAVWLIANLADGTPVHLYGGTHVFTPSR
jgi:hypothetical protein